MMEDNSSAAGAGPFALLPCPFCGDDAYVGGNEETKFFVGCNGCYCNVGEAYDRSAMPEHMFMSAEEAVAAWNRRAGKDAAGDKAGITQAARSDARPSSSPSPAVRDAPAQRKPFKVDISEEWCLRMADLEGDQEIGAGSAVRDAPYEYDRDYSHPDVTALAVVLCHASCAASLVERLRAERPGWRAAIEQAAAMADSYGRGSGNNAVGKRCHQVAKAIRALHPSVAEGRGQPKDE